MSIANNQLVTSGNVIEILPWWAQYDTKPTFYWNDVLCSGATGGTLTVSYASTSVYLSGYSCSVVLTATGTQTVYLPSNPQKNAYFIIVKPSGTTQINGNGKSCYYAGASKSGTWVVASSACLTICQYNGQAYYLYAMAPA